MIDILFWDVGAGFVGYLFGLAWGGSLVAVCLVSWQFGFGLCWVLVLFCIDCGCLCLILVFN